MALQLKRIIIFTDNMPAMAAFYGEVLGLAAAGEEKGWRSFAAGAVEIALHQGSSMLGRRPPKLAFHTEDVAALREELAARGARLGRLIRSGMLTFCDGKDPDGNPFQISDRP
jgi:catechol 2,3-dioxygenase-like lactoylglutathione lyase family enzyme